MLNELYRLFTEHPFICTDTRKITKGAIFFALKGDNFNGNAFAKKALEQGCSHAVIDEEDHKDDDRFILVDDVLTTLQDLARKHRSTLKIPVIGITGSNGKTTTKELLAAVLSTQYNTFATVGNLNNHIGVPLSVLSITRQTEIAIIEMGANHIGEIGELCGISHPDFGLITNIGRAHLEGFGSIEGVIKAKRQLYDHLRETEGKGFVNQDNPLLLELTEEMDTLSYGQSEDAIYQGHPNKNSFLLHLKWKTADGELDAQTNLVGQYNFENAMAAIAVGTYFGIDAANIKKALENYAPSNNRSQQLEVGHHTVIMDAYNANPTSMGAALANFKAVETDKKKVVVLGDMLELGSYSQKEHQTIVDQLNDLNQAYLVGGEFIRTKRPVSIKAFPSTEALMLSAPNLPAVPSYFLIKGSRGIRLEQFLKYLREQFEA